MAALEEVLLAYLWKHEHFAAVGLVAGVALPEGQRLGGAAEAGELPEGFEVTEWNGRR